MNHRQLKSVDEVALPWWLTELIFWIGFCLTEFVWLDLYYGNSLSISTVARVLAEAVIGAAFARPILWSASWLEAWSPTLRIAGLGVVVILISQAWNVTRMLTYPIFFPDAYIWNQYGGWAFSAVAIFALWTALYFGVRAYRLVALQRQIAIAEHVERLNAERLFSNVKLKMLRYQVNPHFIFNTLNSINALIATNRNQDARSMINGLSDLLRKTLEADPPLVVPLSEELDTVERYLQVEKMRFGDRLMMAISADESAKSIFVPSLVLQPLAENAVRHAVEARSAACEVVIEARVIGDRVQITVSDTGPGLGGGRPEGDRAGLGLANVRARIESLYGVQGHFTLSNRDSGGVRALLDLPAVLPERSE
jgi:signal transduction histidine kinase